MPWKHNHISVFLRIFEIKYIFLIVVDEIGAFYTLKNFSSFIVMASPEITTADKNNVSKHLLLSFIFISYGVRPNIAEKVMSSNEAVN